MAFILIILFLILDEYENPYSSKQLPPFSDNELEIEVELRKLFQIFFFFRIFYDYYMIRR